MRVKNDELEMELNFSTDDGNAAAPVLAGATMGAGDPPPPPPSSVHGEVDEDDQLLGVEDSFHEDDNMNAEEGNIPLADNLRSDSMNAVTDDETGVSTHPAVVPTPQQPELTLKEKLVLRERQRRIETERARLKRQFALSAASNDESVEMIDGETPPTGHHLDLDVTAEDALSNVNDQEFEEESTRAHPDEEDAAADEANRRLGFNMERFLRNSDSFHPGEFEAEENRVLDVSATAETKGVVMERFLNELVENASRVPFNNDEAFGVVGRSNDAATGVPLSEPHRSVSFDVDAMAAAPTGDNSQLRNNYPQVAVLTLTHPSSFGEESGAGMSLASNASLRTEANTAREDIFSVGDPPQYSSASVDVMQETDDVSQGQISSHVSDDEPRVLRLTEADMLEMAAIEEASIGNAPPSDRDDVESYSEIGEMTDFGGSGAAMNRFLGDATFTSPDTPTTAMDSASQISHRSAHRGGTSAVSSSSATNEHLEVEHVSDPLGIIESILSTTDATQYFIAPASASVAANPPSDRDHDDDDVDVGSHLNDLGDDDEPMDQFPFDDKFVLDDAGIANTTNRQRRYIRTDHNSLTDSLDDHVQGDNLVDGFDFDKDAPQSPFLERPVRGSLSNDDSFRNLPVDPWSPQGQMNISPLLVGDGRPMAVTTSENGSKPPDMPLPTHHTNYGTSSNIGISSISLTHATLDGETMPLLHSSSIPPEIITRKEFSKPEDPNDSEGLRATDRRSQFQHERFSWFRSSDRVSIRSAVESVFSDVRSEDDADKALLHSESEVYLAGNILARGTLFE